MAATHSARALVPFLLGEAEFLEDQLEKTLVFFGVLEKFRLSQQEWDECARRMGRSHVGSRWQSLVSETPTRTQANTTLTNEGLPPGPDMAATHSARALVPFLLGEAEFSPPRRRVDYDIPAGSPDPDTPLPSIEVTEEHIPSVEERPRGIL
jgi:hypothetical protein